VITLIRRLDDYEEKTTEEKTTEENEVVKFMNEPTDETLWEEVVPIL
jgi:hypothetical protein